MLATLHNVFQDRRGLAQFAFANADLHIRINDALYAQAGLSLPYYVLDPISLDRTTSWLRLHQDIHNRVNAALGIAGNDLTAVDFESVDQVTSWIWLHAQEHLQANNRLGLT